MRWTRGSKPREGDYRTISRFLLFPRCIDGNVRWFENAKIIQQHKITYSYSEVGPRPIGY